MPTFLQICILSRRYRWKQPTDLSVGTEAGISRQGDNRSLLTNEVALCYEMNYNDTKRNNDKI